MDTKAKAVFYRDINFLEAESQSFLTRGAAHEAEPMVRVRWRGAGRYMDCYGVVHRPGDVFLVRAEVARHGAETGSFEILWD